MTLNATGLGIGSSPTSKLHVNGNLRVDGATSEILMATGAERTISASGPSTATVLTFKRYSSGSVYVSDVVFDGSGNVGVGVTPSAWNTNYNAIQLGLGSSLATYKTGGVYDQSFVSSNAFENTSGNWRFVNNGYGTQYFQYAGAHWFRSSQSQ
jgi:hypothetical protein